MIRYPHLLLIKHLPKHHDDLGRPNQSVEGEWVEIDECRCEDDSTKELKSPNGQTYYSTYHVVSKHQRVSSGDVVRCLYKRTGNVRGEGLATDIQNSNCFGFAEFWI